MTLLSEASVTRCATLAAFLAFPSAAFAQRTLAAPTSGLSTTTLPAPTPPGSLVTLSFEDANLDEVVHAMSVMTGRRFVVAATPKSFVANVVAPQKVTVEEAYQALLSVLLANHLTVVPSGPFSKIVDTGEASHEAPVGRDLPPEERYVTYIHKVHHLRAEEVASTVLSKLASHDAQVLAFGNTLILTDTGTNLRRMMKVLDELDVAGAEDKLWLEPLKYAISGDVKKEIDELLDLKNTKDKDPRRELKGSPRVTRIVALERPNAILIVGTHEGYLRLLELLRQIDVSQPSAGQMHVVMLAHAEAKKLVTALTDAVTQATAPQAGGGGAAGLASQKQSLGIFDAPVKVSAEETNNALIVTASAHDFAAISDVIRRLDQPRRQVYIEAVVMDLSVDNSTQVGAAFNAFGNLQSQLGPGAVAYGGFNPLNSIALPTDATTLQGLVLGLRGPSIPVPGFLQSTLGTSSIPGIGFLIDASTVSQDSDVVQTPSVMTTDNMPAEFHMQLNTSLQKNSASIALPPAAGAAGAAAAYTPYSAPAQQNYGKIGPMLQVTPHLNESDDVRLDVEETISDLTPDPPQGTLGTVNFIERHAMTTMTVKDGSTAIIGGLVRNTVQHSSTKVPILGDIPLLGFFFRSSADVVSKANLVLVLTPHIIRDEEDMRKVVTKRMEERQEFLDHYLLFHQDTGPPIGFDPTRGQGLVRMIDQDFKKTDEERRIALDGATHAPALHEERPPIDLPSAPASDAREPATGQGTPGAATPPAATHGGVTRVE